MMRIYMYLGFKGESHGLSVLTSSCENKTTSRWKGWRKPDLEENKTVETPAACTHLVSEQ